MTSATSTLPPTMDVAAARWLLTVLPEGERAGAAAVWERAPDTPLPLPVGVGWCLLGGVGVEHARAVRMSGPAPWFVTSQGRAWFLLVAGAARHLGDVEQACLRLGWPATVTTPLLLADGQSVPVPGPAPAAAGLRWVHAPVGSPPVLPDAWGLLGELARTARTALR